MCTVCRRLPELWTCAEAQRRTCALQFRTFLDETPSTYITFAPLPSLSHLASRTASGVDTQGAVIYQGIGLAQPTLSQ